MIGREKADRAAIARRLFVMSAATAQMRRLRAVTDRGRYVRTWPIAAATLADQRARLLG